MFRKVLDGIEEELVFESELYHVLNDLSAAYRRRASGDDAEGVEFVPAFELPLICWVTKATTGLTLVIMPKAVKEVLRERVFAPEYADHFLVGDVIR